jgi:hypothetical protein
MHDVGETPARNADALRKVFVSQKLDLDCNMLTGLPAEFTSLGGLKKLLLSHNSFYEFPVSILSALTALTLIYMSNQVHWEADDPLFEINAPLLPVLHPGLVKLGLHQGHEWDPASLFHLGRAVVEVADRVPIPEILL